ncbi:hypothetical protein EC968_002988, partial [Mortierella alpina]
KNKRLHLERVDISASKVNKFSLERINSVFQSTAPIVFRILHGLTSSSPSGSRQRALALPVVGSILAFSLRRSSNYLQLLLGLYFYSSGCTRKVINTLHGAGLCVSFPTINRLLKDLTSDAKMEVKLVAKREPFLLVYDNINLAKRKHDQRIDNLDDFENGTTATMILGRDLGSPQDVHKCYASFTPSDLTLDIEDMAHIKKVFMVHFVKELRNNKDGYSRCSPLPLELHLLAPEKTVTHPLPTMKIDESTLEGNKMVMEDIVKTLGLEDSGLQPKRRS